MNIDIISGSERKKFQERDDLDMDNNVKSKKQLIEELKKALLKANQDIEKLSKVKSDFVSIISHELRTPLTSIKESVNLVFDGIAGPITEDQKKFLGITKSNIDKLIKIITDILDFSKMEAGRVTLHKRKMNINKLIEDVYAAVKSSIEQKNLKFNITLSDKVEPTWFDPDRISQAIKNLISNAVKFNNENGEVKIFSSQECIDGREFIKVAVEDTGIGVAKGEALSLFKGFTPLDMSMTRRHSGVGLGLAIGKKIIDLHGGEIWVESKKDVGSKFSFTLPIYKKDEEFNFLLDEAIERARYNDLKLALIIFTVKNSIDANEEKYAEIEKTIHTVVRGPEDKVTRFREGEFIVIMAATDRLGAGKIISRLKAKVKISLNFGFAIYPDDAGNKKELIRKAEKELKAMEV